MEERSIKVYDGNKKFFQKVGNAITKLFIPTKIGFNSMLISMKRNNVLKAYELSIKEDTKNSKNKEELLKKYEDLYTLYLEALDKYIMDSVYKKVRAGAADAFEENALSKYYTVIHLKDTQYVEYKHRKQKFLLELDYQTISSNTKEKDKLLLRFKKFYVSKMDVLYKGILKNYSVQIADTMNTNINEKDEIYNKIFDTLEEYITEILPIKIEIDEEHTDKCVIEEYDKFNAYLAGKLDKKDQIEKKQILLGISRNLFTHSLPLIVAEQCYIKLLKDTRSIIVSSPNEKKRKMAYNTLLDLIEDYNIKLLSTKIYWDKPQDREEYKKFWEQYKQIASSKGRGVNKNKEILFIKYDLRALNKRKDKYKDMIKIYKDKLVEYGEMECIKNTPTTAVGKFVRVKGKVNAK